MTTIAFEHVHRTLREGRLQQEEKTMVRIVTETTFMELTVQEQVTYEELRALVATMQVQPNGLEKILNAMVATGNLSTFDEILTWAQGVNNMRYNARDLTQVFHGPERLLTVDSRLVEDKD